MFCLHLETISFFCTIWNRLLPIVNLNYKALGKFKNTFIYLLISFELCQASCDLALSTIPGVQTDVYRTGAYKTNLLKITVLLNFNWKWGPTSHHFYFNFMFSSGLRTLKMAGNAWSRGIRIGKRTCIDICIIYV